MKAEALPGPLIPLDIDGVEGRGRGVVAVAPADDGVPGLAGCDGPETGVTFTPTPEPGPGPGGRLDALCTGGAGRGVPIVIDDGVGGIRPPPATPGVNADAGADDEETDMPFAVSVGPVAPGGSEASEATEGTPAARA